MGPCLARVTPYLEIFAVNFCSVNTPPPVLCNYIYEFSLLFTLTWYAVMGTPACTNAPCGI